MKKYFLSTAFIFLIVGSSMGQNNQGKNLPENIQSFIEQHFDGETITKAEKNDSWYNLDNNEMYEVKLSNGIKMDFNKEGELTEVDSKDGTRIPDGVLSNKISTYVQNNYRNTHVVSWEKDNDEQEVELADGTDLEFNTTGDFIKED